MRVTPPVAITPAKLTSSSADATFAPSAYAGGTTYAFGALVSVAADYRIYESLQNSNIGNTPSTSPLWWKVCGYVETAYNAGTTYAVGATVSYNYRVMMSLQASNTGNTPPTLPETETLWWIDVGPVNRWAMFDIASNAQTVWTSPLTVVFAPGERINTIGLDGMDGATVTISATSVIAGGTVYGPVEAELTYRDVLDSYQYCYAPFITRPYHVVHDVPPYSDIVVTVTIESTVGNVKIGACIVGTYIELGSTLPQSRNSGKSFSTVDRDRYGRATMNKVRSIPVTSHRTLLPKEFANSVIQARDFTLDAEPALWTGISDATNYLYGMHQAVGFYRRLDLSDIPNDRDNVYVDLDLEQI